MKNGLIAQLIFSSILVMLSNSLLGQYKELSTIEVNRLKFASDTAKGKAYWDSYKERTDLTWPFFCTYWGGYDNNDSITFQAVKNILDSPLRVVDVWDNTYQVEHFRFFYKNLEYTQNDTTLSYEARYFAYSFFTKMPIKERWKQFMDEHLDPDETIIIDKIYIKNKEGTGFIVYDEFILHTK